uniref:FZ domain-containing protein n=1 Tax=Astyanax mexicanus TaxID=7994 RepID=A0A8B9H3I6_ASTMX
MSVHLSVLLLLLLGQSSWAMPDGHWEPRGSSRCIPIPSNMALCQGLGYNTMRMPNLLGHESPAEAVQQSASWLPLLARECHPHARIFLCSLFAPVCLERIISPCRSLCESVQDSCAPIMNCYGYPWPRILHCNQFPKDHLMCISSVTHMPNSTNHGRRGEPTTVPSQYTRTVVWKSIYLRDFLCFCIFAKINIKSQFKKYFLTLKKNIILKLQHGGGSVMVWGCLADLGPGQFAVIIGTINSALYQKILKENVRPSVCDLKLRCTYVLQQVNVSKHTNKFTSEWLKKKVTEWSSQSLIEMLWHGIKEDVYA